MQWSEAKRSGAEWGFWSESRWAPSRSAYSYSYVSFCKSMARQTDSNAGRTQVAQLLASGGSWAQLFRASRTHYNQRSLLANSPAWGVRLPGPRPFTTHALPLFVVGSSLFLSHFPLPPL